MQQIEIWVLVPFILMLLSIATIPLIAEHWWRRNINKLLVSTTLAIPAIIYLISHNLKEELKHQIIFENDTTEVWSLPLRHRVPTAGYLFKQKEPALNVTKYAIERYKLDMHQIVAAKQGEDIELSSGEIIANSLLTYRPYPPMSYAYCSDTNYSARLSKLCQGVDMLYHEATYSASERKIAKNRGHATTADAAKVAQMAGAGKLLIGHFSSRYKDLEPLLQESREIFPETYIAEEGVTFTILENRTKQ